MKRSGYQNYDRLDVKNDNDKDNGSAPAVNHAPVPNKTPKSGAIPAKVSPDQRSAQTITQAIKDDPTLTAVSSDIHVTVTDGAIQLDGEVATDQQASLAARTAVAIGAVDKVENRLTTTE